MTVRDLMKELADCEPEWEVSFEDSRDGLVPVGSVEGNRGCSAVFLGSDEE